MTKMAHQCSGNQVVPSQKQRQNGCGQTAAIRPFLVALRGERNIRKYTR